MIKKVNLDIEFTSIFNKKRKALPLLTKIAFKETLDLFLEDPDHESLRKHLLKGKYTGYQSIDITNDYRAIFKEIKTNTGIIIKFYLIGTHTELYGK